MRSPLASAAELSRLAAGALVLVVAGRFAFVALGAAAEKSEVAPATSSSAPPRGQDRATHSTSASSGSGAVTAAPTPGAPVRVTLMVTAGADRSDVVADGANVGKTPYVGDFSCRVGDVVHFRIVPPRGDALEVDRPCVPGTIKVEP